MSFCVGRSCDDLIVQSVDPVTRREPDKSMLAVVTARSCVLRTISCDIGNLVMWSGNGPFTRPAAEIREAHAKDTWTSGVDISGDGRMVVTRGGDDTVKSKWEDGPFKLWCIFF